MSVSAITEDFSRLKIYAPLKDTGWSMMDTARVQYEHTLSEGTRAHHILRDRPYGPMEAL